LVAEQGNRVPGTGAAAPATTPAETSDRPAERIVQAPEEINEEKQPETDALVPFGYELFTSSPESYRLPAAGPVDPDYPLGPGDQIVLDVWGDTVFHVERELDREGGVNLPDVGRVVLAGLTLGQARETIRRRLERVYSGLTEQEGTTFLSVTLGELRVIRAFVVGRARRPGGYDLSAASTAFHALFYAGGPDGDGSMRDIRVIRRGREVARLDVYEYLRKGQRQGDIRLTDDDTIFIPPSGPRVEVRGEVREPGLYEMRAGETLASLVETAGGPTEHADARVQVERILSESERAATGNDRRIFDLDRNRDGGASLENGDLVTFFAVGDRLRNFVRVTGEVRRPGKYELGDGELLSGLLHRAGGLLETAVLERAEVVRTYEDGRREQVAVDLAEVLSGDPGTDLRLAPRDEVTIHSIWSLRDSTEVDIHGAVRNPGRYELREGMTLRDLLLQAGGLLPSAWTRDVEVSRVGPVDVTEQTAEIMRVPLGEDYLARTGDEFPLEPWDQVFVREIPNYELQRNVRVAGEVRFPGAYTLRHPRETLAEVVERAGGLKSTAYPDGFVLFREKEGLGRVALNLNKALRDRGSNDNVILFAGDSLFVPEEPKTVTVRGEVGWPTSLVYEKGHSIGDYIANAGGTTNQADRGQTRIVYTTGAAARVKKFWFDPPVQPGSTIIVPRKEEGRPVQWGNILRDSAAILASLATVVLVADQVSQ
ncbi:MAG: SLBB domain-containing protein, partial [Gemmatimonadetes bacterium]|nr:SLBB domain-containing protein [Gemmatimonadota bacterium]